MVKIQDADAIVAFQKTTQLYQYMLYFANPLHTFHVQGNDETEVKLSRRRERCTAKVVPTGSDFVADVELTIKREVSKEWAEYFRDTYSDPLLADVYEYYGEEDAWARQQLGRAFLKARIHPLYRYVRAKDVRGGRWLWPKGKVER